MVAQCPHAHRLQRAVSIRNPHRPSIAARYDAGGAKFCDRKPDETLVECMHHPGYTLRAFMNGHAEAIKD